LQEQAPPSRCGVAAGQLVQSVELGPLQVEQLASHAAHEDALLA